MKVARPRETRTLDAAARADLGGSYQALTDGVTHFQLRGPDQGQVVVMLHGGTVPLWTWELQVPALVEAGLPPLEVLRIATEEAAITLGLQDDSGTLEVGKLADIVLLDANPLEDIKNTQTIWRVIKGGFVFDPDELRPERN